MLAGLLGVAALAAVAPLGGQQPPPGASVHPSTVRLDRAAAAQAAKATRAKVNVTLPPGLELTLWAPEHLVNDPIGLDIDPQGTAYVISSSRANLPLDIRGHQDWMPIVHTLKTVEDLRNFYAELMTPENSKKNAWIPDHNKDGVHDIRDLAELKERVHRIRDTDGDGIADESFVMAEGFNADPTWDVIGGVLSLDRDVIVGIAPGVFRLRDANGDGTTDQQVAISEGYNTHPAFGGHGISGVTMGPDGRLYWEVGDMGFNVVDKAGKRWPYPSQGAVLRSEPDGSNFEVFAAGIRNLQEFSFDDHGNLISVDNDGDHQGENERLVYIPYGSDSGWRSNWQYGKYTDPKNNRYNVWMDEGMYKPRHEGQSAAIVPPIAPWHAGPSGMAYNPGTALSDEWRNHFFVSSFPGAASNAYIYAFTLKEDGAGFAMDRERELLRGILTIGMRFGPDGALYITDWITGWESKDDGRLWKIDAPAAAGSAVRKDVQSLLAADFSGRGADDVAGLLRHADMRVRQKAQFELVRRGEVQPLVAAARDTRNILTRLHGLWGIAQLSRKETKYAAELVPFLADSDGEVRAQAARMIGDVRYAPAADRLLPLLMDTAPRARFFAAEALGRIAYKPAGPALVDMLADNDGQDVYIHHAGSLALASLGDATALQALSKHESRAVRTAAVVALRRMRDPAVASFLADADEHVVTDAARAINDDGGITAAVPQLAGVLTSRKWTNEALLRRAINANLRVGTNQALERVAAFAADPGVPAALRVEAVDCLGVWPAPSAMDRVDGSYLSPFDVRGAGEAGAAASANGQAKPPASAAQGRDAAAARAALQRLIDTSAKADAPAPPAVKAALAQAAGRLQLTTAAPVLVVQLKSDPDAQVRLAALQALQSMKAGNLNELMQVALADKDPAVRRAALGILPGLSMSAAAKAQHLATLITEGSLPEKQGALEVLGTLRTADSRRLLGSYLDDLTAGRLAAELQVDLLEAVQADGAPPLQNRLQAYQKARSADTLVAAFRDGLLNGGEAKRGYQVIAENPAAQCMRCHSIFGQGADVGPNLTKIGSSLTREQLVQALLDPNARIAPGYGTVSVTLRDGRRLDGTLREDTDSELVLLVGTPPVEQRIPKAGIASRSNPVSAMPPFGQILKAREIRDIVELLAALK